MAEYIQQIVSKSLLRISLYGVVKDSEDVHMTGVMGTSESKQGSR